MPCHLASFTALWVLSVQGKTRLGSPHKKGKNGRERYAEYSREGGTLLHANRRKKTRWPWRNGSPRLHIDVRKVKKETSGKPSMDGERKSKLPSLHPFYETLDKKNKTTTMRKKRGAEYVLPTRNGNPFASGGGTRREEGERKRTGDYGQSLLIKKEKALGWETHALGRRPRAST